MAEQDIREDQMTITNTVDYLRGLKGKDSVLMAISDLFSDVVRERGGFNYSNQEIVNAMTTPGVYNHGDAIVNSGGSYGLLLVIKSGAYVGQIDFTYNRKFIFRLSSNNGSTWSEWKSVTLT